jgi:internalin A
MRSSSAVPRFVCLAVVLILPAASSCDRVPTFEELAGEESAVEGGIPEQGIPEQQAAAPPAMPSAPAPAPRTPQQILDEFLAKESRMRTAADLRDLAELPPEVLQQVTALDLRDSQVNDPAAPLLAKFPALVELDLTGTAITNDGMKAVAQVPGLQRAVLDRMIIDGRGLTELSGHRQLRELSLVQTPLSDQSFQHLRQFDQLEVLRVSGSTTLQGHGFDELVRRGVLTNLRELEAGGTAFGFHGLQNIDKLAGLEVLVLSDAQVSDKNLPQIGACRQLKRLDLRGNLIGNEGLKHLVRLKNLEWLSVAGCLGVSDEGLRHLRNLDGLKELDLSGCHCRPAAVRELKEKHLPDTAIRFENEVL